VNQAELPFEKTQQCGRVTDRKRETQPVDDGHGSPPDRWNLTGIYISAIIEA
jgi:hypothetical protein